MDAVLLRVRMYWLAWLADISRLRVYRDITASRPSAGGDDTGGDQQNERVGPSFSLVAWERVGGFFYFLSSLGSGRSAPMCECECE